MKRNISWAQDIMAPFFHKLIKLFTASAHEGLPNNVSPGLHNPYSYRGIIFSLRLMEVIKWMELQRLNSITPIKLFELIMQDKKRLKRCIVTAYLLVVGSIPVILKMLSLVLLSSSYSTTTTSVVTIALLTTYFVPCNVNCTPIKFIQFLGSVWSTILCDSLQYISHIICKLIQLEHEKVIKHLWPPVTCSERKNAICLTNSRWAHEVSRQVQLCWTHSI